MAASSGMPENPRRRNPNQKKKKSWQQNAVKFASFTCILGAASDDHKCTTRRILLLFHEAFSSAAFVSCSSIPYLSAIYEVVPSQAQADRSGCSAAKFLVLSANLPASPSSLHSSSELFLSGSNPPNPNAVFGREEILSILLLLFLLLLLFIPF